MDRAKLQVLLAEGLSLEEIGKRHGLHESTVGYWVKKHGLTATGQQKHAARGGLTREQLETMVQAGASIAEIAEAVDRSKARPGLRRYRLGDMIGTLPSTELSARRSEAAQTIRGNSIGRVRGC